MNRLEIINQIQELIRNKSKSEIQDVQTRLFSSKEIQLQESALYDEWNQDHNQIEGEQWSQFVRTAVDFNEIQRMYARIRYLLRQFRKHSDKYFSVQFGDTKCEIPDRITELHTLMELYQKYLDIYQKIENKLSFQHNLTYKNDTSIHGTVNWNLTLKKSHTLFPTSFELMNKSRNFVTPENILLVLCAILLQKQTERVSKIQFKEPLYADEISIISTINTATRKILKNFPFYDVVQKALEIQIETFNDKPFKELELKTLRRINDGLIDNRKYHELVQWITQFRAFDLPRLATRSKTRNFLLESTKNLDTMYEIWIFFEILHHFQKYSKVDLILDEYPQFFEFRVDGKLFRFYYERKFELGDKHAWATPHTPDFTVMHDEKIIAVFDAKNWKHKPKEEDSPINKILSYITNLDVSYGAIFWIKNESTELIYPRIDKNDTPKFHNRLKVAQYKMNPYGKNEDFKQYESVLDKIYHEIEFSSKLY